MFDVALPPEFVPVTVEFVALCMIVGVPVITQVDESESPAGRDGEIEHDVIAPPVFVGLIVPMDELIVQLKGVPA